MKKLRPEIALSREGRQLSRAIVKGRSLCTGSDWKCDLTDPHSKKENLVLLRKTLSGYQLRLPPDSVGTFRKAGSSLDLDQLVAWGLGKKKSGWYTVPLDKDMSCEFSLYGASYHLTFTEESTLAEFSEAPVAGVLPLRYRFGAPDQNDMLFVVLLLTIFVLQMVMLRSLGNYPIPEITSIKELPRRISRLILEPVAPPPETRVAKPGVPDTAGEPAAPTEEPVPAEVPSPAEEAAAPPSQPAAEPSREEKPSPGVGRETIRRQVSKVGVLGVLTGKGTAGRSSRSSPVSALQLDEDLQKDLDQILGNVKNISIADAGPGDGSGTGDQDGSGTGLIEIEGILDGEGVGEQIQVSRLGDVSQGSDGTGADADYVQEVVSPEQRDERSSRVISRVVASHTGAIRYAYNRELRKNPALRGKIVLTFTIAPEGSVTECKVEESEMNWPPLENSLVRMVRGWKFPEIPEGTVTVSYPLVFFPSM